MRSTIISEQIDVPSDSFFQVAVIIVENDLYHDIIATDDEDDTITVEIHYSKEQRKVIHDIRDIIDEHNDEDDENEEYDD